MPVPSCRDVLEPFAGSLGLDLPDGWADRLDRLVDLLLAVGSRTNLTALTDRDAIVDRHLSDSLALAALVGPQAGPVVDVGSGAGFPALPMAVALPDLEFTLVESSSRKVAFLREAIRVLGLGNARVEAMRAEEAGRQPSLRDGHRTAVARAFAPVPVLLECALPLVAPGGRLVAPRGADAAADVAAAPGVPELLGGRFDRVVRYRLSSGLELEAAIIAKVDHTPDRYPRRPGVPSRRPLCGSCG